MMNFLRKHQKKLLWVISIVTIASVAFWGSFNPIDSRASDKNRLLFKALDGSPVTQREADIMVHFLSLVPVEWVRHNLVSNGLVSFLAEKYFEEIKEDFQSRVTAVKRFRPYVHPRAPFINANDIWIRFCPDLPVHLKTIRESEPLSHVFPTYFNLYLEQRKFTPQMLRSILREQQKHLQSLPSDPYLNEERNLSLFGYRSFEEWFGKSFVDRVVKFFFNVAVMAQQQGLRTSLNEARADLLDICLHAMKEQSGAVSNHAFNDAHQFLQRQVQLIGGDPLEVDKVWRKVVMACRLFNEVGSGILLDSTSHLQFNSFADQQVTLECYQLPKPLRQDDFSSFMRLHCYLEKVAPSVCLEGYNFFSPVLSVETIEKNHPEFVFNRYEVEFRKIQRNELISNITLKATWDYEISEEGWGKLQERHPILKEKFSENKEDRYSVLEALSPKIRLEVDASARSLLLDLHPEWIQEGLSRIPFTREGVLLRLRGVNKSPFKEMGDYNLLRAKLEQAVIGESFLVPSSDRLWFWEVVVWDRSRNKEVMTFEEAIEYGDLDQWIDEQLESAYIEARQNDPDAFKSDNGVWKLFSEVRDQVAHKVYGKYFQEALGVERDIIEHIWFPWMIKARDDISVRGHESVFLVPCGDRLIDQWKLVMEVKKLKRSEDTQLSRSEIFTISEGKWSSLIHLPNANLSFFRVLEKGIANSSSWEQQVLYGQGILAEEAKKLFIKKLLDSIE